MTRSVQLWGGSMDGAVVFMGDGPLPARVGMHRTGDGALVPIRGAALLAGEHAHVAVYERAAVSAYRAACGDWCVTGALLDGVLYVHRDVLTRWTAR